MKEFYSEIKLELFYLLFGLLSILFWWSLGIDFNFWLNYVVIIPLAALLICQIGLILFKWYK